MAAQVNVYVPDNLKARLEKAELPLSQLARSAWERELAREEEAAEMGEIRIDATDKDGADIDLRITGTEVGSGVYRTQDGNAVLVGESGEYWMWTGNDIDNNEEGFSNEVYETLRAYGEDRAEFANVLRAFGVKPIIRL
jgi:hypothetical protein